MYINKVIFEEWDNVEFLANKYFENQVVIKTDYGTTEIVAGNINALLEDVREWCKHPDEPAIRFTFTDDELIEDLNRCLGKEVTDLLLNNEIDFILVV